MMITHRRNFFAAAMRNGRQLLAAKVQIQLALVIKI